MRINQKQTSPAKLESFFEGRDFFKSEPEKTDDFREAEHVTAEAFTSYINVVLLCRSALTFRYLTGCKFDLDLMVLLKMTQPDLLSHAAAAHFDSLSDDTDLAGGSEHTLC